MQKLSFIIPVLNESKCLSQQRESFMSLVENGHEIIVVDGGSVDKSVQIAESLGCQTFI